MCSNGMCGAEGCNAGEGCEYLPNVESTEFQILGSISLSGDPLLTSLQLGRPGVGMPLLPGQAMPTAGPTLLENPLKHILPKAQIDPQTPIDGNPAAVETLPTGNDMPGTWPNNTQ
jgi:hypothetical protein